MQLFMQLILLILIWMGIGVDVPSKITRILKGIIQILDLLHKCARAQFYVWHKTLSLSVFAQAEWYKVPQVRLLERDRRHALEFMPCNCKLINEFIHLQELLCSSQGSSGSTAYTGNTGYEVQRPWNGGQPIIGLTRALISHQKPVQHSHFTWQYGFGMWKEAAVVPGRTYETPHTVTELRIKLGYCRTVHPCMHYSR